MSMVINLTVTSNAMRKIRTAAKNWYPREFFAALIGDLTDSGPLVFDIWIPPDLDRYTRGSYVLLPESWNVPANDYADDLDANVVGSIHSHPYSYEDCQGKFKGMSRPVPSDGDWDNSWHNICGIISVIESSPANGSRPALRTKCKFFGPGLACNTKIIETWENCK